MADLSVFYSKLISSFYHKEPKTNQQYANGYSFFYFCRVNIAWEICRILEGGVEARLIKRLINLLKLSQSFD